MIKLSKKYRKNLKALNKAIMKTLQEGELITGKTLRLDTRVTEINIHHYNYANLLTDGTKAIR